MSATTTGQLLDIAGLADRLGVGERMVRRLVSERRIPFLKIGRHVRFEADAVEAWIRESRVEPSQPFPTRTLTGARR
ncbi:MAG: DNA-binding protein [Acidimicrobiaceae bacterium]|nr:DNA-binding protein [Acidimicrobiaceae bacterium]